MGMTARMVLEEGMRFQAESNSGQRLVLDAAAAVGGGGGGPTPKELLPATTDRPLDRSFAPVAPFVFTIFTMPGIMGGIRQSVISSKESV